MFDEATIAYLQSGCAVIIGTVDSSGRPHAGRGHGLTVVSDDPPVLRLLLDAADATTLANLRETGRVAITTADVETLRSLQLKGETAALDAGTPDDRMKYLQYRHDFLDDIVRTDGTPLELLELWGTVEELVACEVRVGEVFDQTPGPRAGDRMAVDG